MGFSMLTFAFLSRPSEQNKYWNFSHGWSVSITSKAGSHEQTYGTGISNRKLAGCSGRELLRAHGARSGARPVSARDRATGTRARAGA